MNRYIKNIKNKELNRVLVDLDGTLAKQIYPKEGIGGPIKKNVSWILEFSKKNKLKIWIWTTRPSYDEINIRDWCRDNKIPIHGIITGKPIGRYYIDDRNLPVNNENEG